MKERPILFNTEMVRAILDGRKTQTRRPMKPQPSGTNTWKTLPGYEMSFAVLPTSDGAAGRFLHSWGDWKHKKKISHADLDKKGNAEYDECGWIRSPFGKAGDKLWVREAAQYKEAGGLWLAKDDQGYIFDSAEVRIDYTAGGIAQYRTLNEEQMIKFKPASRPSIHMPRWACRLRLTVKRVWVERVQDISEDDAKAEGVQLPSKVMLVKYPYYETFSKLWDSIYGTWSESPWVWCCEFEVTK